MFQIKSPFGREIKLAEPAVMGIINLTPDSFYDGGKNSSLSIILQNIEQMVLQGVDIIDVGAVSSRPGAKLVSPAEEKNRIEKPLRAIRKQFPDLFISIDTFRSEIAEYCVENFEIDMINDISAGELDNSMFQTVSKLNIPYCMMHMQGIPENMQNSPSYTNIISELVEYFLKRIELLKTYGYSKEIIIDPGFGFGKTIAHNYQLLANLRMLKTLQLPILVGLSRKSMIYKLLETNPEDSLNATTALHSVALLNGANIIRVHDVKDAVEVRKVINPIQKFYTNLKVK